MKSLFIVALLAACVPFLVADVLDRTAQPGTAPGFVVRMVCFVAGVMGLAAIGGGL